MEWPVDRTITPGLGGVTADAPKFAPLGCPRTARQAMPHRTDFRSSPNVPMPHSRAHTAQRNRDDHKFNGQMLQHVEPEKETASKRGQLSTPHSPPISARVH